MWLLLLLLSRGSAFYLPKKSTCSWDRTASRLVSYRLALSVPLVGSNLPMANLHFLSGSSVFRCESAVLFTAVTYPGRPRTTPPRHKWKTFCPHTKTFCPHTKT